MSIYLIPLLTAFTGWFVIWLTIYLLFNPKEPVRILGFTLQGALPKGKQALAVQLGKLAARELNFDQLAGQLNDGDQLKKLTPYIKKHLDNFLQVKLQERLPVIAMFVSGEMLTQVKQGMLEEIEALLPQLIIQYLDGLKTKIDIEQIVTAKISDISSNQLESMLSQSLKKPLGLLKLMGVIMGFVMGLIQLLLLTL